MFTDCWAIQAGEPPTPNPGGYPPKVSLEEFLGNDRLKPEDVDDPRLAEAIANPDLETRGLTSSLISRETSRTSIRASADSPASISN